MRGLSAGSMVLILGLFAGATHGQETPPDSSARRAPAAVLVRPVPLEDGAAAAPLPSATLGKPVPLDGRAAPADRPIVPVTFRPVVRLQGDEPPRPLPLGPLPPLGGASSVSSSQEVATGQIEELKPPTPVESALPVPGDYHEEGICDEDCGWGWFKHRKRGYQRWHFSAEYLMWWVRDARVPPLVTTGSVASNGFLSDPSTVILFGGNGLDYQERHGARFLLGKWFDDCHTLGWDTSVFFLGSQSTSFTANSGTTPVIARPFFNLNTGQEFSELVASPGRFAGTVTVDSTTRLWGLDTYLKKNLCTKGWCRWDALGGFKFLEAHETLNIGELVMVSPTEPRFPGSTFQVQDSFDTRNYFYGGQVGTSLGIQRGRWSLDMGSKIALGGTKQVVTVLGSQVVTSPTGAVSTFNGGLLALPSNSGRFSREVFSVVPEANFTVGYQVTNFMKLFFGYNFLYWTNVARPGDQIDRVVDVTLVPNFAPPGTIATGQLRPAPTFIDTDIWVQGISFGLEFRW